MLSPRRIVIALAVVSSSLALISCGGSSGGGMKSALPPVFTSTPSLDAAQAQLYSYSISDTDPSGGTVSFSLTTAPTGA